MKKLLVIPFFLFGLTGGAFILLSWKRTVDFPLEVYIPKGSSCRRVLDLLEEKGLIKNRFLLSLFLRISGKSKKLKSGEYEFYGKISDMDVIEKILKGEVKLYTVTIPEGANIYQIARAISPVCPPQDFIGLATSSEIAKKYGLNSPSLEGFLFPDTYAFEKGSCDRVIEAMVKRFLQEFTPGMKKRASELGMRMEEVVILASIIEKEAKLKEEMPLISAVFHNRLKAKMPLQADPTVIYGLLPHFDGNLKKEHLQAPTPYNTYRRRGLPPTPICSPSKDALLSALYPADVPYLYFVARKDGTHVFTTTLREHNYYVNLYQKGGR